MTLTMSLPGPKVAFDIIQNTGSTSDGMGGILQGWEVYWSIPNGVYSTERLGNVEERRSGKETIFTIHTFYVMCDGEHTITEAMRVRYNSLDYDIMKLDNPAGLGNHWQIKTKEIEEEQST